MLQVHHYIRYLGKQLPREEFVSKYRKLYQAATDLFAEFDPCDVHDGTCYRGRTEFTDESNFCCQRCKYLTDTGCSAEALWCKLWACGPLIADKCLPEEFRSQLRTLSVEMRNLCRYFGYRKDLSDHIMHIYGKKGYRKWLVEETKLKSNSISSSSGK